jgi:hypothetical protein
MVLTPPCADGTAAEKNEAWSASSAALPNTNVSDLSAQMNPPNSMMGQHQGGMSNMQNLPKLNRQHEWPIRGSGNQGEYEQHAGASIITARVSSW